MRRIRSFREKTMRTFLSRSSRALRSSRMKRWPLRSPLGLAVVSNSGEKACDPVGYPSASNHPDEGALAFIPDWVCAPTSDVAVAQECLPSFADPASTAPPGPWQLNTPADAFDAIDMVRPITLSSGVMVMAVDEYNMPLITIAVDEAPPDDIMPILAMVAPSLMTGPIPYGVIVGIVRPESTAGNNSWGQPLIRLSPNETMAWLDAAHALALDAIALHDIIIIEPDRWHSLASAAGVERYAHRPQDCA
jgi:hypothetical protein